MKAFIKKKYKTFERKVSTSLLNLQKDNKNPVILLICLFVLSIVYRRNLIFTIPRENAMEIEAGNIEKKILFALNKSKSLGNCSQSIAYENLDIGNTELLFVNFHEEGSINFNVFNELYESARQNNLCATILNLHGLEIEIQRNFINTHLQTSKTSIILFFEVHTDHVLSNGVLSVELLRHFSSVNPVVVAPICFDIWREFDLKYFNYWREVTSFFIHIDPTSARTLENDYPMLFWPFILPSQIRDVENRSVKKGHSGYQILLSGSIHMASRIGFLAYLNFLSIKMKFELQVRDKSKTIYNQGNAKNERSSYLASLASSTAVVDLNERGKNRINLITFRALETIFQGGCLITQVGSDLTENPLEIMAIPYLHYIPFSNARELGAICKVLGDKPFLANLIKDACEGDFDDRFRKILWGRLFDL